MGGLGAPVTPRNPYLKIIDIQGISDILRDHPALFMVDNTFASPYLQNPLALGADLVLHSTTKYVGGHSDTVGGAVIGNDPDVFATMKFHQNAAGGVPGPFDVWLALRGIKTLAIRMERHSENAQAVASLDESTIKFTAVCANRPRRQATKTKNSAWSGPSTSAQAASTAASSRRSTFTKRSTG